MRISRDRPVTAPAEGSAEAALRIDSATGLTVGVRQVLSPHADARPARAAPELVIVHGISLPPGEFGGPWIDRLFTGNLPPDAHPFFREASRSRVSAHALIDRRGEIVQYVPFGLRAWHAGVSEYQGRASCNDFSIGIELEGSDDIAFMDAQYEALNELLRSLALRYGELDIAGHSDVAPGRKTDPGPAFEWDRVKPLRKS